VQPDDTWDSYQRAVVGIRLPGGGCLWVGPAVGADEARWPWPTALVVHVFTAWDPGLERLGRTVNRERQASLEGDLRRLAVPFLPAVGVDPETGRWDEGVAVHALAEREVLALAGRYGQDAVYAWTPAEWAVVACDGGWRLASGWAPAQAPEADFPFRRDPAQPMR
jgi:Protein of unknown function (DUF3293)